MDTDPMDRVSMLHEAQMARAINESYETWFDDKKRRESLCEELMGTTSSTPALMDTETLGAVSKSKGSQK